jgi:hypothetical protein
MVMVVEKVLAVQNPVQAAAKAWQNQAGVAEAVLGALAL